jgi:hypothetical protein
MQISKIFLNLFLVGFLLFGFLYVRKAIQYGKDKAVWEAKAEELFNDITALEVEAEAQYASAMEWKGEADEHAEEIVDLKETLRKTRIDHARELAKINELAPDEVVSEFHSRLQVAEEEIILTEQGVVFSLAASRLVLSRVRSYDFNLAFERPLIEKIVAEQGEEIRDLRLTITGFENTTATLYKDIDKWKEAYEGEHKLRIAGEGFNLFSTKNLVVGGVITAVLVGLSFVL